MSDATAMIPVGERLRMLNETGPDTAMGKLLRRFWQPVGLANSVEAGKARAVRILSEDLTLYRGASGKPYLVGGRCPHRLTRLHTGWVQGEEVRCIYHGWKFNGAGRCVEAPAEGPETAAKIGIVSYPVHEYAGLFFAWLGGGDAPEFDLPRKPALEREGGLVIAREQPWPCNWFHQVENSLDAVHVSFVHHAGKAGPFGQAITGAIPQLSYEETDSGIRQTAVRSQSNVRVSDWTFPNNNHILIPALPGDPWVDVVVYMSPIDDHNTNRFLIYSMAADDTGAHDRFREHYRKYGDYNPVDHHDELFNQGIYPEEPILQLTGAQDYVATLGQGVFADRDNERLGKSDAGVVFLRRLFWREMDLIRHGLPTKQWRRLDHAVELPRPKNVAAE